MPKHKQEKSYSPVLIHLIIYLLPVINFNLDSKSKTHGFVDIESTLVCLLINQQIWCLHLFSSAKIAAALFLICETANQNKKNSGVARKYLNSNTLERRRAPSAI